MTAEPRTVPRFIEGPIVIAIVLIAIIFRFAQFNQVPPGLHYDEAMDAKLAQEIRAGATSLYFEEGWGREPLYHYLVAFTLNFTPDPTTALRLTSAVLGLIQLLAAYALFRSMFGVPTALMGAAWIAVLFWTVSTSRAGLRNITLTTLATLTAWAFWRAVSRQPARSGRPATAFVLPGLLLGLTIYTYQPSRVVPLIYLVFVGFLTLRQRDFLKQNWRALSVFFGLAVIVALPLIVFLLVHPQAETARAFQTEPIRALLGGNFQPALETMLATLKMFTFDGAGDPQILYNLSGRPIFIGLGSILFYLGLIVCAWRWKRPAYAFMLIWLVVTLLPNMVTAPAPFFYRAIAAQTPVAVMPAIATVAIGAGVQRMGGAKRSRLANATVFMIAIFALGQTAITTWHDYFDVWGNDQEVRFQYSADYAEIAAALKASPDTTPVAVSGYFVEDADPIIFTQALNRSDIPLRWFDAREALIAAADSPVERLALPAYTPLDGELKSWFLNQVEPIASSKNFKIYPFDAAGFRAQIDRWTCTACPARFNDQIELVGIQYPDQFADTDQILSILTAWQVLSESQPGSTAIFVHLLDDHDHIVAQDDRLGVPRHTWQPGDAFVQVHRLNVEKVSPGKYRLALGLYNRADQVRWAATDRSGQPSGDRVIVGEIEVTP